MTGIETADGWRKASSSGGNSDNCVQVKAVEAGYEFRDSKDPEGPTLTFTAAEFGAFKAGVVEGEFEF